jgi:hypothetical protein
MNLNVMDPKVIVLAALVILIIAVRIRFRSTGGRHFGRPSPNRGQLPVCA